MGSRLADHDISSNHNSFMGAVCSEGEDHEYCKNEANGGVKNNLCTPQIKQDMNKMFYSYCPMPDIARCTNGEIKLTDSKIIT